MIDRFGRPIEQANGQPQQLAPFPIMCQGVIAVAPVTKLCWDQYFGIIQRHYKPDMTTQAKKRFADDAMEMAMLACERIGGKIDQQIPPGWNEEEAPANSEPKEQSE